MKKKEKISHEGHRERLLNLVYNVGLENVSEVQAVEYFLTYVFPRGDVNPLAHTLLNRFGNFANIVDADYSELMKIDGINDRSAKRIKMIRGFFTYYPFVRMKKRISLKNNREFFRFLSGLLRFEETENLYIFAIDHSFKLLQKRSYDLNNVRQVGIQPMDLYNYISSTKATYLAVAHNHPHGTAEPSKDDHQAVKYIEQLLQNVDCKLLDSFIVGEDGIYSERNDGFIENFDEENMIDFLDTSSIK